LILLSKIIDFNPVFATFIVFCKISLILHLFLVIYCSYLVRAYLVIR